MEMYTYSTFYAGIVTFVVYKDGEEICRCWGPDDVERVTGININDLKRVEGK